MLISDSWGMKDDFCQTFSMFLINLLPDQAPTDSEKLFYSPPSYQLCAARSSQVLIHERGSPKVDSQLATGQAPHGGRGTDPPTPAGAAARMCIHRRLPLLERVRVLMQKPGVT